MSFGQYYILFHSKVISSSLGIFIIDSGIFVNLLLFNSNFFRDLQLPRDSGKVFILLPFKHNSFRFWRSPTLSGRLTRSLPHKLRYCRLWSEPIELGRFLLVNGA